MLSHRWSIKVSFIFIWKLTHPYALDGSDTHKKDWVDSSFHASKETLITDFMTRIITIQKGKVNLDELMKKTNYKKSDFTVNNF